MESDREKFIRLAEKRVRRSIKQIRLIGNLSNRSNYEYTDEDAKKIIRALQNEINDLKDRFDRKGKMQEIEFSLD